MTNSNPKTAHGLFVNSLKVLQAISLDKLVLDNKMNQVDLDYDKIDIAPRERTDDVEVLW